MEINPARNTLTFTWAWMNFEKFNAVGKANGFKMIWELSLKAETMTKYRGMMIKIA